MNTLLYDTTLANKCGGKLETSEYFKIFVFAVDSDFYALPTCDSIVIFQVPLLYLVVLLTAV